MGLTGVHGGNDLGLFKLSLFKRKNTGNRCTGGQCFKHTCDHNADHTVLVKSLSSGSRQQGTEWALLAVNSSRITPSTSNLGTNTHSWPNKCHYKAQLSVHLSSLLKIYSLDICIFQWQTYEICTSRLDFVLMLITSNSNHMKHMFMLELCSIYAKE